MFPTMLRSLPAGFSRSRSEFSRIAFFFAIGTGIGGVVSPWLFANLINEGR
jgi:hypothetical protein